MGRSRRTGQSFDLGMLFLTLLKFLLPISSLSSKFNFNPLKKSAAAQIV